MTLAIAALGAIALAAGLTMLLVPVVRSMAVQWGLMDIPSGRKIHRGPTPLGGGVAMLLAILLPSVLVLALASIWAARGAPGWLPEAVRPHLAGAAFRAPEALVVLGGAAALCVLGLVDDRRHLGPWSKLGVQFAVVLAVMLLTGRRVLEAAGEPFSSILTVLWMLVIINAINFLDNMDGLAAGITLICAAALLWAAASIGQLFVAGWVCLLIGATGGFLLFNFPPARIFMGDAGSLVLGYFLAVLSMLTTYYTGRAESPMYGVLVPLLLLAVPLYDFASVMTIRIREKRNPMVGDTRHFSHRLVRRGMSTRSAVLTIYLCTAVTCVAAVLLPHVPGWGALLLTAQTLGVLSIIALLEAADARR